MKAQKSWTAAELVASSLPADFPAHIVPKNRITPSELLELIAAGKLRWVDNEKIGEGDNERQPR